MLGRGAFKMHLRRKNSPLSPLLFYVFYVQKVLRRKVCSNSTKYLYLYPVSIISISCPWKLSGMSSNPHLGGAFRLPQLSFTAEKFLSLLSEESCASPQPFEQLNGSPFLLFCLFLQLPWGAGGIVILTCVLQRFYSAQAWP